MRPVASIFPWLTMFLFVAAILAGLLVPTCEVGTSLKTSDTKRAAPAPNPVIQEFPLADGTPCVAVYTSNGGVGVSCGWGMAKTAQ
jgi:hypothetical protein